MNHKKQLVSFLRFCIMGIIMLSIMGCNNNPVSTNPQNLNYNKEDGSFSFSSVKGADTYLVGVSKLLNDVTGKKLESMNGAVQTTLSDGRQIYLWSEQSGSITGLADNDEDGIVDGKVIYREYSSSAATVGAVMSADNLPLGHYLLQAMAASNEKVPNPEPSYFEFVINGTLAEPIGFTASINDNGNIEINAPSSFYLSCLTVTGLPNKMVFEVSDGTNVLETLNVDDFSYTNAVLGPNKAYTFNNATVTGSVSLDRSKDYTVTITAVGDGDSILDATSTAYMETSTQPIEFASTIDTYATATAGLYDVKVTLGSDNSGTGIYELVCMMNDIVILRESGTYLTDATVEVIDDLTTYPENAVLTFTSVASDLPVPILDQRSLTIALGQEMGGGMPPVFNTVYNLVGQNFNLDDIGFNFEAAVARFGPPQ